jgi:hypothetical protein
MPADPIRDDPKPYYASAFGIGIVAAAVMTALMWAARAAGWTQFDLAMTLGTVSLFVDEPGPGVWFQGFLAVLGTGGLFALVYAAVFETWGYKARAWEGALLGAVHAVIGGALLGWVMPLVHSPIRDYPLLSNPGFMAMNYGVQTAVIFLALHVIFGAMVGGWMHVAPLATRHLGVVAAWHRRPPAPPISGPHATA